MRFHHLAPADASTLFILKVGKIRGRAGTANLFQALLDFFRSSRLVLAGAASLPSQQANGSRFDDRDIKGIGAQDGDMRTGIVPWLLGG